MTAISALVLVASLLLLASTTARSWYDPLLIWCAAFSQAYVVRALMIGFRLDRLNPDRLFLGTNTGDALVRTNVLLTLSVAAVAAGLSVAHAMDRRGNWIAPVPEPSLEGLLWRLASAATVLSLVMGAGLLIRYGGVSGTIFAAKREKELAGLYALRIVPSSGLTLAVLCDLHSRASTRGLRRAIGIARPVLCGGVLFLYGSRGPLVFAVVAVALGPFLTGIARRPLRLKQFMRVAILLPVVVIATFGLLVVLRDARDDILGGGRVESESVVRRVATQTNLVKYDSLVLAIRDFPAEHDLRGGTDLAIGVSNVVPRAVWSGKPTDVNVGAWFRKLYEPSTRNGWPIGSVGEWYINFGLVGSIIGGVFTGFLLGAARRSILSASSVPFALGVSLTFVFHVLPSGVSVTTLTTWIMYLLPLALVVALRGGTGVIGSNTRASTTKSVAWETRRSF